MLGAGRVLLALVVVGLIAAGVTGGPFQFALGVDHCDAGGPVAGDGGVPEFLRGMYAVDLRVQVGGFVVDEGVGVVVRSDAVAVAVDRCPRS